MSDYFTRKELYHHGVKGQHWGERNGPPYPLSRNAAVVRATRKSRTIEDAIHRGEITKSINKDKQKRHTLDDHIPGKSYLNGGVDYAQDLVNKLSGTGKPLFTESGEWTRKERVTATNNIGVHVGRDGSETATNKAMIVYSKTGSHIYPRKE